MATVLCSPELTDTMARLLFQETGTFGVRIREQDRLVLAREWRTVTTPYGEIRIKIGSWQGEALSFSPEYEDCRAAAEEHKIPLKTVYQAALAAYHH